MRIATLFATLLPFSFAAVAHGDGVTVAKVQTPAFASIDRNGDQRISKTEAGAYKDIIDRFAYIDTNGDGFITADELAANLTARSVN
ncbi:MAG TPA: hypothetical protein PKE27_06595 [Povalibacter sp.]|uniref:hypothetical protein n=1 Tax=Povalibacter sp. TaxID=1962978 RepID=UPI002C1246D5|nr:hypothetical protein [Povalibacter sp.]HMN44219.1 hypothetical protein [Povalibacter sp.]